MKPSWISITTAPELTLGPCGFRFQSQPVLGVCRDGTLLVVFACQEEEDGLAVGPVRWVSDCSEGWDVTDHVLYWQALPAIDGLAGVQPRAE